MRAGRTARAISLGLLAVSTVLPGAMVASIAAEMDTVPLIALTADGALIAFPANRPGDAVRTAVVGVQGTLLGIDYRPADGRLYGVTTTGDVYTIDPSTGAGTLVSTLTRPFLGGRGSGLDFTPKADRLRLVSENGQNLRVNVEIGATAVDGTLAYAPADRHYGARPTIAAVAYTNNIAGALTTEMYDLDAALDALVRQEPPNDGILLTVGPLGVDVPPQAGFEIVTDTEGKDTAIAAFGATLYRVDLATGAATSLGAIGGAPGPVVGLSIGGSAR
jgi:hypothetical protein